MGIAEDTFVEGDRRLRVLRPKLVPVKRAGPLDGEELDAYGPFHAARADFYRRTGRLRDAERSYARAIELATNNPERRFLTGRLREVQQGLD